MAEQIADGALKPDRRRMKAADRRETTVRAGEARDDDGNQAPQSSNGHMDGVDVAPKSEQRSSCPPPARRSARARRHRQRHIAATGDDCLPRGNAPRVSIGIGISLPRSAQHRRDVLEPGDQRRRKINAGEQHQRRCAIIGSDDALTGAGAPGRLAERERHAGATAARRTRPAARTTSGKASRAARAKVELTIRNSLMNTPKGGRPAMATTPTTRLQPSTGCVTVRPRISAIRWVPFACAIWPTAKKIADLVRLCMVMCSRPAKLASGPPMPKAKTMMPMCSIEE